MTKGESHAYYLIEAELYSLISYVLQYCSTYDCGGELRLRCDESMRLLQEAKKSFMKGKRKNGQQTI